MGEVHGGRRVIDRPIAAALERAQVGSPWTIQVDLGGVDHPDTPGPGFPDALSVKRGDVVVTYERKEEHEHE